MGTLVLLGALFAFCGQGWARLPGPYEQEGRVESVDCETHTIVLAASPRKFRLGRIVKATTFVWMETTQFFKDGRQACALGLLPGARVRLYYRYSTSKQPPFVLKVVWGNERKRVSP